jgi:hypothetical protein
MIKYYIYHIKDFQWKNGKIGKIGCAQDHIERVSEQGYSEYTILEIHDCIYEASKREIELQKQYGYPVDRIPYYQSIERRSKGGKIGSRKGGRKGGLKNVETGHIQRLGKIHGKIVGTKWGKINGSIQGKKCVENGHMDKIRIMAAEKNKRAVLQFTMEGTFIKEWQSIKEASNQLNLSHISTCASGRCKSSGGYVWKYKS